MKRPSKIPERVRVPARGARVGAAARSFPSAGVALAALLLVTAAATAEDPEIEVRKAVRPTPGNAILQTIPAEASARLLERGWVLIETPGSEDDHFEGLEALVIFERPPNETLRMLAQTGRQTEYRKDVHTIETIEFEENGSIDEHRMRIMFVRIAYRIDYDIDYEALRMTWRLDPRFENSLKHLEGYWELYELGGGRTLARFGTDVEVGPAIPPMLQDSVTRSKVPKSIDNTRKWVNSGGKFRP